MNYKEQVKQIVEEKGYINVNHFGTSTSRRVRQVLSELRKEGFITVPMNSNWTYFHVDRVDQETLNHYYNTQKAHLIKQYYNTLLPIAKEVKDNKLIRLMGGFDAL